jgi:hypothetical protein
MTDTSIIALEKGALAGFPDEATQADPDFWFGLIGEREGGAFLNLTDRTMQAYRQRGGGPKYVQISSRCIRYRRFDLKVWTESRLRASTSDDGQEAA